MIMRWGTQIWSKPGGEGSPHQAQIQRMGTHFLLKFGEKCYVMFLIKSPPQKNGTPPVLNNYSLNTLISTKTLELSW